MSHLGDLVPFEAGGILDRLLELRPGAAVGDDVEPMAVAPVLGHATFTRCGGWGNMAPRMYRSTNGRASLAEPEIWFRIVHVALDAAAGAPVAAYREQTVEIALGPKGAFENGNVGRLTRRVPANQVVSAIPPRRGMPKPPKEPKTPRVVELLRKALEWQALLASGEASNQAAIARREGITRARVTHVMGLLRLAPEIQQHVLSLPDMVRRPAITERALRPIAQMETLRAQLEAFEQLSRSR